MSELLNRLTPKHLRNGWPIYWRLALPFWIHLIFILIILSSTLYVNHGGLIESLKKAIPTIVDLPYVLNVLFGVVLYFALYPFYRKVKSFASRRFESDYYKRQFSIFGSIEKFNRGLISLILISLLFITTQRTFFSSNQPFLWLVIFLSLLILVGIVAISIALYGWLATQFTDEETKVLP